MKRYCIYYRVPVEIYGKNVIESELDMSQRSLCEQYVCDNNGEIVATFTDPDNEHKNRDNLLKAVDYCKYNDCELVIAKLERLSRNVTFTKKLVKSGIQFHFCDMPIVNSQIFKVIDNIAQYERNLLSVKTSEGLQTKISREGQWKRGSVTDATWKASAKSRRDRAINNENNIKVWMFLSLWQEYNLKLTANTSKEVFENLCLGLNQLGYTTSTGLQFNSLRLRAMWAKLKNLYRGVSETELQKELFVKTEKEKIRQALTKNDTITSVELDITRIDELKRQTIESQSILSEVFDDSKDGYERVEGEDKKKLSTLIRKIVTRNIWKISELESLCKDENVMWGAVFEQINDYVFDIVDDILLEEDGDSVLVNIEYKNLII